MRTENQPYSTFTWITFDDRQQNRSLGTVQREKRQDGTTATKMHVAMVTPLGDFAIIQATFNMDRKKDDCACFAVLT